MKILVLEHEPIVAQALQLLLSRAAYEVEIGCVGEADLSLATPDRYDLIVLDAGVDSAALGPWLRSPSPAKALSQPLPPPILLLTDSAQTPPPWATETLVKPVDAVALVARVRALLGQPTASPVVEHAPALGPVTDRNSREGSLKASAAQLSGILDSAIAAIYSFRIYGNGHWEYEYWSAGCERLFGFPRSAYADQHFWLSRVHPDDRGQVLRPLRDLFLAAGDAQVEYRFHRQDGSLRWFSSAYSSQKIADDGWLVTTVSHDITDRKQSEAALRASEEKYRLLFESMDEGFCLIEMIFDDHGKPIDYRFLEINPSFEQQTGLVEAQGKRIRELLPNIEASWVEIFGQVWRTGEPIRFENHAAEIHSWFDVFAFRFGAVEYHQVALLFRNVTERHQAEIALQESERKLRAVFDSTFEFMGLLKADGTVVDANRTALMAIACDLAAVVGQPFWQTPWWAHFPEQRQRCPGPPLTRPPRATLCRWKPSTSGPMVRWRGLTSRLSPWWMRRAKWSC